MATAYAARRLGIPATIVVPNTTPALTIERLKNEGATVEVVGEVSADREVAGEGAPDSWVRSPIISFSSYSHCPADVG